ncbi:MAG: hypothetical protein EBX60_10610 [Betaproteobacteria bacterium]|nr:hypothetical protein [Betaproteobacteria bacterium]NDH58676.1 hypothetical protein [Betaproteobacteria bacterium]
MRFYDYIAVLRFPNGHEVEQEIRAKTQADAYSMANTMCEMMDTELVCLEREEDQYKEDLQLEALYEERYDLGD